MEKSRLVHGKKWMPAMYVAYYGIIEKIANEHGYALCVHGSVLRDFDLIAVPFDEIVKPHEEVLREIKKIIGIEKSNDKIFDIVGHEPHGRICYTIECGGGGYFDISFTPTIQQDMQKIKADLDKESEMKDFLNKMNEP